MRFSLQRGHSDAYKTLLLYGDRECMPCHVMSGQVVSVYVGTHATTNEATGAIGIEALHEHKSCVNANPLGNCVIFAMVPAVIS